MQKILRYYWLPNLVLLAQVIFYWVSVGKIFNPLGIILVGILLFLMYTKSKLAGILIGGLFLLLNTWMLLALVSELREFDGFDYRAWGMLGIGLSIFLTGLAAAVLVLLGSTTEPEGKEISL